MQNVQDSKTVAIINPPFYKPQREYKHRAAFFVSLRKHNTMPKRTNTDTLKKNVLAALEKSLGIVTKACEKASVSRSTYYQWYNDDSDFKAQADKVSDYTLDFVESKLFNLVEAENATAILFYLKTKGKKRGYIERGEIEHSGKIGITIDGNKKLDKLDEDD